MSLSNSLFFVASCVQYRVCKFKVQVQVFVFSVQVKHSGMQYIGLSRTFGFQYFSHHTDSSLQAVS